MVRVHVSHGLYGPHRSPPRVPSSPPSLTCNWLRLHGTRCPQQKLASGGTRVRREASFFSSEAPAHWIRRGHISGRGSLHLRGKVAQSVRTDPQFPPIYGGFAALRAAVGGSWTSPGMQQPDGKRLILVAMTPRQRRRGHRGRAAALPSAKELLLRPKFFKRWLRGIQRSVNSRSGAAGRVGGAGGARTQDVSGWPVSTRTGGALGTRPPLRSVHISVELYFLALSVCRIDQ